MGVTCGHHNGIAIEQSHGIPNDQAQCKSMESQCIAHRTSPWNSQCSLPIQSHRSHMGGVLPNVLHIKHFHGPPMEHYPCKSMGATCGHHHAIPIEPFHGHPNEQYPTNTIEATWVDSPCITHKSLPWCSYGAVPMQFHGWRCQ